MQKLLKAERKAVGEAISYLENGAIFLKYGNKGKPHPRHVYAFKERLYWRENTSKIVKEKQKDKLTKV